MEYLAQIQTEASKNPTFSKEISLEIPPIERREFSSESILKSLAEVEKFIKKIKRILLKEDPKKYTRCEIILMKLG